MCQSAVAQKVNNQQHIAQLVRQSFLLPLPPLLCCCCVGVELQLNLNTDHWQDEKLITTRL